MLIGRDAERGALRTSLAAACQGHRRVSVITGPPGIGKTALVDDLAGVATLDALVLRARSMGPNTGCAAHDLIRGLVDESAAPSAVALDVFRRACGSRTLEVVGEALGAIPGPSLVAAAFKIVTIIGRKDVKPSPDLLAGSGSDKFALWSRVLESTAATRPVVVVLDDAQWLDEQTSSMLTTAVAGESSAQLHVVLGQRSTWNAPANRMLQELRRHLPDGSVEELVLPPLAEEHIVALCGQELGGVLDLPRGVALELAAKTQGNPLRVRSLISRLRSSHVVSQDGPRWTLDLAAYRQLSPLITDDVTDAANLDGLAPDVRRMLECGAIWGRRFPVFPACRIAGLDEGEAVEALRAAIRSGLIVEDVRPVDGFDRASTAYFTSPSYEAFLRKATPLAVGRRWHSRVAEGVLQDLAAWMADGRAAFDRVSDGALAGQLTAGITLRAARAARHAEAADDPTKAAITLRKAMRHLLETTVTVVSPEDQATSGDRAATWAFHDFALATHETLERLGAQLSLPREQHQWVVWSRDQCWDMARLFLDLGEYVTARSWLERGEVRDTGLASERRAWLADLAALASGSGHLSSARAALRELVASLGAAPAPTPDELEDLCHRVPAWSDTSATRAALDRLLTVASPGSGARQTLLQARLQRHSDCWISPQVQVSAELAELLESGDHELLGVLGGLLFDHAAFPENVSPEHVSRALSDYAALVDLLDRVAARCDVLGASTVAGDLRARAWEIVAAGHACAGGLDRTELDAAGRRALAAALNQPPWHAESARKRFEGQLAAAAIRPELYFNLLDHAFLSPSRGWDIARPILQGPLTDVSMDVAQSLFARDDAAKLPVADIVERLAHHLLTCALEDQRIGAAGVEVSRVAAKLGRRDLAAKVMVRTIRHYQPIDPALALSLRQQHGKILRGQEIDGQLVPERVSAPPKESIFPTDAELRYALAREAVARAHAAQEAEVSEAWARHAVALFGTLPGTRELQVEVLEAAAQRWSEAGDEEEDAGAQEVTSDRAVVLFGEVRRLCVDCGDLRRDELAALEQAWSLLVAHDSDAFAVPLFEALAGALAREDLESLAMYLESAGKEIDDIPISDDVVARLARVRADGRELASRLGEPWYAVLA